MAIANQRKKDKKFNAPTHSTSIPNEDEDTFLILHVEWSWYFDTEATAVVENGYVITNQFITNLRYASEIMELG